MLKPSSPYRVAGVEMASSQEVALDGCSHPIVRRNVSTSVNTKLPER